MTIFSTFQNSTFETKLSPQGASDGEGGFFYSNRITAMLTP